MPAHRVSLEVEVDVHVLPEARRVVVSVGLGIAERLQYRIRLDENVLDSATCKRVSFRANRRLRRATIISIVYFAYAISSRVTHNNRAIEQSMISFVTKKKKKKKID